MLATWSVWLGAVMAAQLGMSQGPGGPPPGGEQGPPGEQVRRRPPPVPLTSDERRLESLRVRFEFARGTGNHASLEAIDKELLAILPPVQGDGGKRPAGGRAEETGRKPTREDHARLLASLGGKYDPVSLSARAKVINALVLESRGETPGMGPGRARPMPGGGAGR
jgi:hypothetical protein